VDSQTVDAITDQAHQMEQESTRVSETHNGLACFWSNFHLLLGVPTTVLAALASGSALAKADGSAALAACFSLTVTALSAGTIFINPAQRANNHQMASTRYLGLSTRLRLFWSIDCRNVASLRSLIRNIHSFEAEWEELNANSPTIIRRGGIRRRSLLLSRIRTILRRPLALTRLWRRNADDQRKSRRRKQVSA